MDKQEPIVLGESLSALGKVEVIYYPKEDMVYFWVRILASESYPTGQSTSMVFTREYLLTMLRGKK